MAYKVFTNGSTLQASEVNDNLMKQAVATFSNAAARTAAITSPVEGQMTYLEDANRYDTWNSSAWVPAFGLTLIKSQTIGTAVSSVTVTNAFSSDFDNYRIVVSGGTASGNALVQCFLGSSAPANGYYMAGTFTPYAGGALTSVGDNNASRINRIGYMTSTLIQANVEVEGPFLAKNTIFRASFLSHIIGGDSGVYIGFLNNTISYTDVTILPNIGTMTGGTIQVYGYKKA